MKATFVSVWDGDVEIRTNCNYDPERNVVSDIESTEDGIEDLDILEEEYVELPTGDIIKTFTDEDTGRRIVDGQLEE